MNKNIFSEKNKGFTMIEMVIAIFILVVAIIGSYYYFSRITIATSVISSRLTAAYLAQEGLEIIRNMRDDNWLKGVADWAGGFSVCSSGCEADYTTGAVIEATVLRSYTGASLDIDSDGFYNYFSGSPTKFKRKITVTPVIVTPDDTVLQVSVLMEWEDRGELYNFTAEEKLYNWHVNPPQ